MSEKPDKCPKCGQRGERREGRLGGAYYLHYVEPMGWVEHWPDDHNCLLRQLADLQAIVDELCAQAPPPDWEPSDGRGDLLGYGEYGDPNFVDDVDVSKPDDVHHHGVAVGMWRAANRFREAAKDKL